MKPNAFICELAALAAVSASAAGGVQGFDGGGIEILGIDETRWEAAWRGNDLVLSSIPEPAAFAAALGAAALGAAALALAARRAKGR